MTLILMLLFNDVRGIYGVQYPVHLDHTFMHHGFCMSRKFKGAVHTHYFRRMAYIVMLSENTKIIRNIMSISHFYLQKNVKKAVV